MEPNDVGKEIGRLEKPGEGGGVKCGWSLSGVWCVTCASFYVGTSVGSWVTGKLEKSGEIGEKHGMAWFSPFVGAQQWSRSE